MSALVSVMMPVYNASASIPRALASLFAQSYEEWECIVVDDGSTDGSADVVTRCRDSRVRCVRLPENRGRAVARQTALDVANGRYLAFLDADDRWRPRQQGQSNESGQ